MEISIKQASSEADYQKCLAIRRKVFIEEQGVPEDIEIDEYEKESEHFRVEVEGEAVATGRFRVDGPFLKFERIATLPSARGKGVGKALMEAMQVAGYKKYPYHLPFMHSQSNAISFYEKLGWIPLGETFFEAGIPHRMMILPPKEMADLKKLKCLNDSKTPPVILSFLQIGSI